MKVEETDEEDKELRKKEEDEEEGDGYRDGVGECRVSYGRGGGE